jgi:nucleoside-diphosphate-sugar epimerase
MSNPLAGKTVAVTGASGFVGGRFIEMLQAATPDIRTRRLSRHSLTDEGAMRAALEGCGVLVHCAFDFLDLRSNVAMCEAIGRACAAGGIRLVHVSTAAVYEPFPDHPLDESGETGRVDSEYTVVKTEIENLLMRQVRELGLDLIILQPTIIYGPHGRAWTDSPVKELLTGTVVLPEHGEGVCNAVYIDDVCHAIMASLTAAIPSGHRFLISGPQPTTWRAFYTAYQDILDIDAVRCVGPEAAAATPQPEQLARPAETAPQRRGQRIKQVVTSRLGARRVSYLNVAVSVLKATVLGRKTHIATGPKLALLASRCDIQIDKAKQLLGYDPQFDLQRGMAMTAPYVIRAFAPLARLRGRKTQ